MFFPNTLNCKPGDIAVVVSGHPENLGKHVTCIELCKGPEIIPEGYPNVRLVRGNNIYWLIDVKLTFSCRGYKNKPDIYITYASDKHLMPIGKKQSEQSIVTRLNQDISKTLEKDIS